MIRIVVYITAAVFAILLLQLYLSVGHESKPPAIDGKAPIKKSPLRPISKLYNAKNLPLEKGSPKIPPGAFLPCSNGVPLSHLKAFTVGDTDNDGRNELIISEGVDAKESRILVIRRDPSGAFLKPNRFVPIQGDIKSLAVGDVNGDGNNEIAAVDFLKSSLTIYVMKPSGDLTNTAAYGLPDPRQIMLGDFNHDRLTDVLLYKLVSPNKIASVILYQRPSGFLGSSDREFYTYIDPQESVRGITMAEVTENEGRELIISHGDKKEAAVTATSLTPPYASRTLFYLPSGSGDDAIPVAASYVDEDGLKDLIVYKNGIYAHFQKNDGSFSPSTYICGLEYGASALNDGIAIGDMDGNGSDDIIVATRRSRGDSSEHINILCRVPIAP
jgi:hypothetical protein